MKTQNNVITKVLLMSDATWLRHANPWSVWTRIITCLPLLTLAIWSRTWIGRWSILPILVALLWIWVNPGIFSEPESTDNWASQGVLGERIWMNRKVIPIPRHHVMAAKILIAISGLGILPFSYGVWQFSIWPTLFGGLLMYVGKLWYFDRMVWLYKDMKDKVAEEEGAVPKQLTIK
jgi:hypothetical protein